MFEIVGEVYSVEIFNYFKCIKCSRKTTTYCSQCKSSARKKELLTKFKIVNSTNQTASLNATNQSDSKRTYLDCTLIGKDLKEGLYRLQFKKNTIATGKILVDKVSRLFEDEVREINNYQDMLEMDGDLVKGFKTLAVQDFTANPNQLYYRSRGGSEKEALKDVTNSTQEAIDGLDMMLESQ